MTQYIYGQVDGITVRRSSRKSGKSQFSTRSLERFLSENNLSKKAWLTTAELVDILVNLKHNQVAQNYLRTVGLEGLRHAPEKIKQKAYDFMCKAVAEAGDELVDLKTFEHPLSEVIPHPEDPSDALGNMWWTASLCLRESVQGNEKAREIANSVLFSYNPLKALPDWDNFPPLKSEALRVVNDLQEGWSKRAEKAFNQN